MRIFASLLLLLALSACARGPGALGITGPHGAPAAPEATHAESNPLNPSLQNNQFSPSNQFAPSMVPTTNGGRYWGYN